MNHEKIKSLEGEIEQKINGSQEKNKEEKKKEAIEEAYKLNSELMKDKVAELTGDKKGEADPNSLLLERNAIRKKLSESGIISEDSMKSLSTACKWGEFQRMPLNSIKEQLGNHVKGEYAGIREIPVEAIELENKAMEVIKDCEDGWVRSGAFQEYLNNEIENLKLKSIREKIGTEMKKEESKPGFETLAESIKTAKLDMFSRMLSHNESQLGESQKAWKNRLEEWTRDGKRTEQEVLSKWLSDQNISGPLNSDLENYRNKLHRNLNQEQVRADKNINRAEITGLIDYKKASEMRDKIVL